MKSETGVTDPSLEAAAHAIASVEGALRDGLHDSLKIHTLCEFYDTDGNLVLVDLMPDRPLRLIVNDGTSHDDHSAWLTDHQAMTLALALLTGVRDRRKAIRDIRRALTRLTDTQEDDQ